LYVLNEVLARTKVVFFGENRLLIYAIITARLRFSCKSDSL